MKNTINQVQAVITSLFSCVNTAGSASNTDIRTYAQSHLNIHLTTKSIGSLLVTLWKVLGPEGENYLIRTPSETTVGYDYSYKSGKHKEHQMITAEETYKLFKKAAAKKARGRVSKRICKGPNKLVTVLTNDLSSANDTIRELEAQLISATKRKECSINWAVTIPGGEVKIRGKAITEVGEFSICIDIDTGAEDLSFHRKLKY